MQRKSFIARYTGEGSAPRNLLNALDAQGEVRLVKAAPSQSSYVIEGSPDQVKAFMGNLPNWSYSAATPGQ